MLIHLSIIYYIIQFESFCCPPWVTAYISKSLHKVINTARYTYINKSTNKYISACMGYLSMIRNRRMFFKISTKTTASIWQLVWTVEQTSLSDLHGKLGKRFRKARVIQPPQFSLMRTAIWASSFKRVSQ